ncbi:MAG: metal ABC transporter ATP-binding protein [Defluviitaleaceae bacterium]|nr:metal ABC transporter ATP-binding protein [Defluviitaleaceae bacterium]MCL2264055.1 metal ABC transporter ATP-binding protein [Defluviitaleaceae bacterium]
MTLISCKNAAFAYEAKTVVQGLNFEVGSGNYLCIVGENGSGKSTLMKGILGLIKPKEGEISFGGGLEQQQIGYLPQQNSAQKNFPASVYEVVLSGQLNSRGILPFYSAKDKQAALENIEKLGIMPIKNKSFRELSGGQQQRALLARALCATKKALLLDEPAAGLDPLVTAELYAVIKELSANSGITIIMISHDIRAATEYASHILHLKNKQLFFGKTDDYLQSPAGKMFADSALGGQ